jgi:hypothetical protein
MRNKLSAIAASVVIIASAAFVASAHVAAAPGGDVPVFADGAKAPFATFLFDSTPLIERVSHSPSNPGAGCRVKVSAVARPDNLKASLPVARAKLFYSVDGSAWQGVEMARGDADPDYFFAYLPPQKAGAEVSYYIEATDTAGNKTSEMPGPAGSAPGGASNFVGVDDSETEDYVVPKDIDIVRLEVGYDQESLLVRLRTAGKPGKGDAAGRGAFFYFMPILNPESGGGGMAELFNTPLLAYAPLLSSYLGVEPQGLFLLSSLLETKKPIPGADVKLRRGDNDLLFRFNRAALGPNASGEYKIMAMTAAVKTLDGLLPWEASPYLTFVMRNHKYKVRESAPEETEIIAGAAEIDITPPVGTPLAGYAGRQGKPSDGVLDPLMAQALAIKTGGESYIFITSDTFLLRRKFHQEVALKLERSLGIPRDHIVISASHSHSSSGAMFPELALLSGEANPQLYADIADRFVKVAKEAHEKMSPARVGAASAHAPGLTLNRRQDGGPVDDIVRVVRFDSARDGAPIAVIFNYSAHPTVLSESNMKFSAEYPGSARRALKEAFPGVVGMFMNGTLGNAGPACPGECGSGPDKTRRQGELLAAAVVEAMKNIKTADALPVQFVTQEILVHPEMGLWTTMAGLRMGDFAILTIPGEMFVELGFPVRDRAAEMGVKTCVLAGVTNDTMGYIIPEEWYHKHIYEATFAMFGPKQGEFVRDRLLDILAQLE